MEAIVDACKAAAQRPTEADGPGHGADTVKYNRRCIPYESSQDSLWQYLDTIPLQLGTHCMYGSYTNSCNDGVAAHPLAVF